MTTTTCLVCGAAEEPGPDHTCPVCGADLPEASADEIQEADPADTASRDDVGAVDGPSPDEVPPAPTFADASATGAPAPPPPPPPSVGPGAPTAPQDPTWPTGGTPVPPPPPGGGAAVATSRPSPHDPSHPSGLSSSLRTYGMLTHLSAFAGALVALAFIGPLIMWLVRRDEHPFVDHHGKEALNFNLSMLLYFVIGVVVSIATVGIGLIVTFPAAAVFFVTWIVTTILAAVKANAGEGYRYPLTIRFVGEDV